MNLIQKTALLTLIVTCAIPILSDHAFFGPTHRAITSARPEEHQILPAGVTCTSANTATPATLNYDGTTTTLVHSSGTFTAEGKTLFINHPIDFEQGLEAYSGYLVVFGNVTISGDFGTTSDTAITVFGDLVADGLSVETNLTANIESPILVRGNLFFQHYHSSNSLGIRIASFITADTITFNDNRVTSSDSFDAAGIVFDGARVTAEAIIINNNSATNNGSGIGAGVLFENGSATANIITISDNSGTNNGTGSGAGFGVNAISSFLTADTINIEGNQGSSPNSNAYGASFAAVAIVGDSITINNNDGSGNTGIGLEASGSSHITAITLTHTNNTGSTTNEDLSGATISTQP